MEKLNFRIVMAALLFMIPVIHSAENMESGSCLKSEFVGYGSDGINNYKVFKVVSPSEGYYHMAVWHNPAMYYDGTYTRLSVDVNDLFVGYVSTQTGNWQSSSIDNSTPIRLVAGPNYVSVYTPSPEVPNVESIIFATDASQASFLSTPYNDYLQDAKEGHHDSWDVGSCETNETSEIMGDRSKVMIFNNIPLKYSFFTYCSLNAGSELNIVTRGSIGHEVDVFYFGQLNTPVGNLGNKITQSVWPASNSEAEGLNWLGVSEDSAGLANVQKIDKTIRITKTGYYILKLRSKQNGVLGTVDMTVNGTFSFRNCPVYYAGQTLVIPDSTVRTLYTKCSMPLYGDPMLFIEGNVSDRIVDFNDDGNQTGFGQSLYDSFISRSFNVKTSAFHISNYSSVLPTSFCDVYYVHGDSTEAALAKKHHTDIHGKKAIVPVSEPNNQVSFYPESPSLSTAMSISSSTRILGIRTYDLSGRELRSLHGMGQTCFSPLRPDELGISEKGVYLFVVNTENGIFVRKINFK